MSSAIGSQDAGGGAGKLPQFPKWKAATRNQRRAGIFSLPAHGFPLLFNGCAHQFGGGARMGGGATPCGGLTGARPPGAQWPAESAPSPPRLSKHTSISSISISAESDGIFRVLPAHRLALILLVQPLL